MKKNGISNTMIDAYLQKICESKCFESSPRNIRLLKFLVQQARKGANVKEQIIGIELFKTKYNPDQNDAKVRVYMYNLRKKLEEYYSGEGLHDDLVFSIEKGQYNLCFIEKPGKPSASVSKTIRKKIYITVSAVLSALIVTFLFYNKSNRKYCWDYFFETNDKTLCVVSDHFAVRKIETNGSWSFKFINGVTNEKELANFLQQHKEDSAEYSKPSFAFITKMGPVAMHDITKYFVQNNSDFDIALESEFSYEDIRNKNLIFIGQYSTMNASASLFLNNSKQFKAINNGFAYSASGDLVEYKNSLKNEIRVDYSMVSFIPLNNGLNALFFTSNHDIGVIATVQNFTDKQWLENFYKNIPNTSKHFNALFKVTGLNRTEMSCELVEIELFEAI